MKRREIYSDLRCIPPVVVRIDGRNFKNALSRMGFEKPYDERFTSAIVEAIEAFFKKSGLSPVFAYTFSDEISFFFRDEAFDGRIEKMDSIIPSYISSAFSMALNPEEPVSFDSRIIPVHEEDVREYLIWRQDEAWRNCINSYAYYTLISEGMQEHEAAKMLKNKGASDMHELLFERGINISKVPTWQRRGIMVMKKENEIEGFNPQLNVKTTSIRSKVFTDYDIPLFSSEEGEAFLEKLLAKNADE
ncbi:tRNA(His) guanylyltransferase Thg1 family protein [Methanolobus sediminis]|uniref:tRNA(His) guanylyltransferase n=1 Tax=Methanolobus sediminis TaxID=3072978 RepID=A0AA51UIJ8_9EURY|nr:tRNA(His) guanylyltransferase Thg1 family protein [Methanolobus sediminis]WMW24172.1 tRNA(His) guanylyltransferase Thg1 family protein [Methanolobus sediminis]